MSGTGGMLTKAGVPTSGVAQVETAQIVGTISGTGDATFTLTSAIVTGSPLAISVPVVAADTPTITAAKAAVVLNATAAVSLHFTASSNVADLILTAKKAAANDATLNLAYTNGTCAGLTPDATSNDTTAGVKADWRGVDKGTRVVNTSTNDIYINTGTVNVPTWTLL
jgi:hypothetical protein